MVTTLYRRWALRRHHIPLIHRSVVFLVTYSVRLGTMSRTLKRHLYRVCKARSDECLGTEQTSTGNERGQATALAKQ